MGMEGEKGKLTQQRPGRCGEQSEGLEGGQGGCLPPGSEPENGRVRRGQLPLVQGQSCNSQQATAWPSVFSR